MFVIKLSSEGDCQGLYDDTPKRKTGQRNFNEVFIRTFDRSNSFHNLFYSLPPFKFL